MKRKKIFHLLCSSIGVYLFIFQFVGWGVAEKTVHSSAQYTSEKAELSAIKRDLDQIDLAGAGGRYRDAGVLIGKDIKARDIYRAYLKGAAKISQDLLLIRNKLDAQHQTFSLQELGAMAQEITFDNLSFRDSFQHGETNFQTYQLIEKAIFNLEDAMHYWKIANHYRRFYRGSRQNRAEDQETLQVRLQTAINSIEALQQIIETREALEKDLNEE